MPLPTDPASLAAPLGAVTLYVLVKDVVVPLVKGRRNGGAQNPDPLAGNLAAVAEAVEAHDRRAAEWREARRKYDDEQLTALTRISGALEQQTTILRDLVTDQGKWGNRILNAVADVGRERTGAGGE